jgi:hypothetical protein
VIDRVLRVTDQVREAELVRRIDRRARNRAMAKPSEDRGIGPLVGEGMATRHHVPERQLRP